MARPRKVIDLELLQKLAEIHCTQQEMSDILDISVDTLAARYSDVIKKGQSVGKKSLRRKLFELALEKGNLGALIWLSKQHLGMSEKIEEKVESKQETKIIYETEFGSAKESSGT